MYWAKEGDFETHENVLSVIYNGAIASGLVYAQDEPTGVLAESYLIKLIGKEVYLATNLYLSCVLTHVIYPKYSRELLATWANKVENEFIALPTTKSGEIDFDYMENYIQSIVNEALFDMGKFIEKQALLDCILTEQEKNAVKNFERLEWKEFNIIDVFDVKNTHNILSSEIKENFGTIPYLCASSENNGVSSYISYNSDLLEKGNCIFIGGKTFVVSYQENDFFSNDSHNLALYIKNMRAEKSNQLYLATCVRKSLAHKYSWGNSISNAKIKNDKIMLPVNNEKPDFSIMQDFINAMQKLVIKDVVEYANSKIAATKQVIDPH